MEYFLNNIRVGYGYTAASRMMPILNLVTWYIIWQLFIQIIAKNLHVKMTAKSFRLAPKYIGCKSLLDGATCNLVLSLCH